MTVLARSKLPDLHAGYLLAHVARVGERRRPQHAQWLRTVVLLAGLVVAGAGVVLGLAVVWNQLARALPLTGVLHRPRAWRALLTTVAGLVLVALARRKERRGTRALLDS
jgi:hypothetical protein